MVPLDRKRGWKVQIIIIKWEISILIWFCAMRKEHFQDRFAEILSPHTDHVDQCFPSRRYTVYTVQNWSKVWTHIREWLTPYVATKSDCNPVSKGTEQQLAKSNW